MVYLEQSIFTFLSYKNPFTDNLSSIYENLINKHKIIT